MQYENITRGIFLDRPDRFVARVDIDGKVETVHVKNTGRCRELLLPSAEVYLTEPGTPGRKTVSDQYLHVPQSLKFMPQWHWEQITLKSTH